MLPAAWFDGVAPTTRFKAEATAYAERTTIAKMTRESRTRLRLSITETSIPAPRLIPVGLKDLRNSDADLAASVFLDSSDAAIDSQSSQKQEPNWPKEPTRRNPGKKEAESYDD
jgi:hypothetical protein